MISKQGLSKGGPEPNEWNWCPDVQEQDLANDAAAEAEADGDDYDDDEQCGPARPQLERTHMANTDLSSLPHKNRVASFKFCSWKLKALPFFGKSLDSIKIGTVLAPSLTALEL